MMVVCAKCGCTITMYTGEGPLYRCPMCGHQYAQTTMMMYIGDDDRTKNVLKSILDKEGGE